MARPVRRDAAALPAPPDVGSPDAAPPADAGRTPPDAAASPDTAADRAAAPDAAPAAAGGALPAPWKGRDVGAVKVRGASSHDGATGTFTIQGTGKDVWHGDDYYHYVYRPWRGDGEIVVRVVDVEKTDGDYERGGILFSHDPEFTWVAPSKKLAPGVQLAWNRVQGVVWGERVRAEGQGNWWGPGPSVIADGAKLPIWLKVVRKGNRFSGAYSTDGQTWKVPANSTRDANSTIEGIPETIWVGLFGCAHSDTKTGKVVIDSVKITGGE